MWGRPNSICTQRALWACAEAELAVDLTLASATNGPQGNIYNGFQPYGVVDTPDYRAMNPNGTVPTIKDGDFVLWESNAIVAYIAQKYAPDLLYGGRPETFARACQWMSWTNEYLEPHLHTLVMELVRLPAAKRSSEHAETARQALEKPLAILEAHLAKQPHVAGEAFSLGDIPPAAAVQRWLLFDLQRPAMPAIAGWMRRLAEREGFRRHVAPPEFHLA
jgi:glutathione S-transferase